MKIVVMLSGGLDSTALAYHLLEQWPVKHEIHLHHANFNYNRVERPHAADAEKVHVRMVLEWLEANCRPFTHSISRHDFPAVSGRLWYNPHMWVAWIGTHQLFLQNASILATGRIATDRMYTDICHVYDSFQNLMGSGGAFERRMIYRGKETVRPAFMVNPIEHWTKGTAFRTVPRGLIDLTISCLNPQAVNGYYDPCGQCRTCGRRSMAKKLADSDMSDEEMHRTLLDHLPGNAMQVRDHEVFKWPVNLPLAEQVLEAYGILD